MIEHGHVAAQQLELELDSARLPQQEVATLAVPDPVIGIYVGMTRQTRPLTSARAWWPLTVAPHDHRLSRVSEHAFELELLEGRFLSSEFEQLFRGSAHPLRVGDRVVLDGLTVEPVAADAQGLTRVRFTFARSLEDPDLVLLHWRDGRLRRYAPPPIGASQLLPVAPSLPLQR